MIILFFRRWWYKPVLSNNEHTKMKLFYLSVQLTSHVFFSSSRPITKSGRHDEVPRHSWSHVQIFSFHEWCRIQVYPAVCLCWVSSCLWPFIPFSIQTSATLKVSLFCRRMLLIDMSCSPWGWNLAGPRLNLMNGPSRASGRMRWSCKRVSEGYQQAVCLMHLFDINHMRYNHIWYHNGGEYRHQKTISKMWIWVYPTYPSWISCLTRVILDEETRFN